MLCCADHVSNKYLVAKLVELLFVVNPLVNPYLATINLQVGEGGIGR